MADKVYKCPPVLFIVFNRPKLTQIVFNQIRSARPPKIYIACDGPRINREDDCYLIQEVKAICENIDWPCEVFNLTRDVNLGCKKAVSSAIYWFFENESEGIILEDDCKPHINFFQYCGVLLEKYKNDDRVGVISGSSLCDMRKKDFIWNNEDFIFSYYPSIWGWASWRRVWRDYDVSISSWPSRKKDFLSLYPNLKLAKINYKILNKIYSGNLDTWDYQLSYMLWVTSRLAITPRINLIENIGFGPNATHTKLENHTLAKMSLMHIENLNFPLTPPSSYIPNLSYKLFIEKFATRSILCKVLERTGLNLYR